MTHARILAVLFIGACSTPPAEPSAAPTKLASVAGKSAAPDGQEQPAESTGGPKQPTAGEEDPTQPAPGEEEPVEPEGSKPGPAKPPKSKIELRMGTDPCKKDSDCVKATCCHASMCVSKDKAPSCKDAVCTLDCKYGTMDCGGGCLCKDGKCAANVWMGLDEPG
jgi:hypothetical protein